VSAPTASGLSRLQRAILSWTYVQAGGADKPVAWRPDPQLTPAARAHLSRSLRRLEARGFARRLSPSLTPHSGRTGFVEVTETGAVLARLCHHS
jgi:hypothetical protein